jgi:hypothetical protein
MVSDPYWDAALSHRSAILYAFQHTFPPMCNNPRDGGPMCLFFLPRRLYWVKHFAPLDEY